jgi:hypothetical protein
MASFAAPAPLAAALPPAAPGVAALLEKVVEDLPEAPAGAFRP